MHLSIGGFGGGLHNDDGCFDKVMKPASSSSPPV